MIEEEIKDLDMSPLHFAAMFNSTSTVKSLLSQSLHPQKLIKETDKVAVVVRICVCIYVYLYGCVREI